MSDPYQLSLEFTDTSDESVDVAENTSAKSADKTAIAGPIPYSIKVSARARQVYLRAVPGRGLVVTIPKRFPKREIPDIVESQRSWVEQALAELDAQVPAEFRQWPPMNLQLAACDSVFSIEYQPRGQSAGARWQSESRLVVKANTDDRVEVASCLAAALKIRAKTVLAPWLARLAGEHNYHYKRLAVRGQRSVWGSYSSSGTLSLNYKLLFLSPSLVEYVLLHELAHTRHLDHSPAFWKLLDDSLPGARLLDRELHDAGRLVPPWLELAI